MGPAGLHAAGGSWGRQDNCSIGTSPPGTSQHLQCFVEWSRTELHLFWNYNIMTLVAPELLYDHWWHPP